MSRHKKMDRRTRYTIEMIKEAFLTLVNQEPFVKITISEICRTADITRSTFYLHFSSITDLLNEVIDDALHLSCSSKVIEREYLKENESLLPVCQRVGDSPKYRHLLMDPDLSEYIVGRIKAHEHQYVVPEIIRKTNLPKDVAESLFTYMIYGSFAVNRLHHFSKDANWQRDMEILNHFTDAGYNSFGIGNGGGASN
ncbi:TetR/AcrR family transcriptional regulator [Lactiplantibacillus modestisalitolerans]|uniref:TetR/AcrR family transcriptional regulator n=1 Tax=Lactiplantibacillus modestisalitolerans TaxID=1457219 RepID=A0ABV5WYE9_9LACO|nr:TetR/AcrR family transcriptional regulator [Lactiplantibacillus modestisalitolerans]